MYDVVPRRHDMRCFYQLLQIEQNHNVLPRGRSDNPLNPFTASRHVLYVCINTIGDFS